MTLRHPVAVMLFGLALSGCVAGTASQPSGSAPDTSASTGGMPSQLGFLGPAAGGQSPQMASAWVPNTGFVRGTPEVLASFGRPLVGAAGQNRTVEPCRNAVQNEAVKLGAREVEAVSAGPHRRDRQGRYVGRVTMRITYARPSGYEVRMATLTCIVDRRGAIIDAFV